MTLTVPTVRVGAIVKPLLLFGLFTFSLCAFCKLKKYRLYIQLKHYGDVSV